MPTRSYTVGELNTVLRRDAHLGPWIDISPAFAGNNHWFDVMAFPGEPDKVIAVGGIQAGSPSQGIIVSYDAGVTWQVPTGNWAQWGKAFYEVWVVGSGVGSQVIWVVGEAGAVVKSIDGGLSFNNPNQFSAGFPTHPGGGSLSYTAAIHAIDANTAVVGGAVLNLIGISEAYVWKTIDGGNSWLPLNTGATYTAPAPPSLRNGQVPSSATNVSITNPGTNYPPAINGAATTTLTGSGSGLTINYSAFPGGLVLTAVVAFGGAGYAIGDTVSIFNPNALFTPCILTITNIAQGNPTGPVGGIWMSSDQQTIIVSTGYTQQRSIDFGNTFQSVLPEMLRSGIHLTWYPSAATIPSRFRHTGGPVFSINESIDLGASYITQRNDGAIIRGAHFYSPQNGYYLVGNQIWSTSNGGVTGDASLYTDPAPITLEAVWTEEVTSLPPCYQFTPCDGQLQPTVWTGAILTQYNNDVIEVTFDVGTSIERTLCGTISQVSNSTSCTEHEITIGTDSPAGSITYTDCNGNIQVITYDAVIPPQHFQALIFNICVLDGTTPVLSPGGVTTSIGDPCGTPDPCSLANPFSPSNVVIGTYTDCDTCLGPAPSFPCYNLISCTPETCPDILYATDIELAPYVGQYIEINGNNNCRYLVTATRQGYFTSGLNPLILSNPAGNFQLGLDDHTIQVTSVVVNGTEYVPTPATPYVLTPANYSVVECTGLVCTPVPINTTENCIINLPLYLNNIFANAGVPELVAECADPIYCEGLLNTFLCKIQYSEGTTFSITHTLQSNSGTLTFVYTGVGGNVTGLEIFDDVIPPSVIDVLTCNSQVQCTGNLILDTTLPILEFTECYPIPQLELGEACVIRPRIGEPGFSSKNCDPKKIVDIKCKFGDAVYALFKRMRFGIETCCEYDLDKIEIKNSLVDFGFIYDPDLCVEGQPVPFGCCPQPCNVIASIEIPVFITCPAPTDAIVIIDVPMNPPIPAVCIPPNGASALLTLSIPAPLCKVYRVVIATDSPAGSILYTDCNSVAQVINYPAVLLPITNALIFEFCAIQGSPIVTSGIVTETVNCTDPCFNTLWEITLPPSAFGLPYEVFNCVGPGLVGFSPPAGLILTVCGSSLAPPVLGPGGTFVNLGQCP